MWLVKMGSYRKIHFSQGNIALFEACHVVRLGNSGKRDVDNLKD